MIVCIYIYIYIYIWSFESVFVLLGIKKLFWFWILIFHKATRGFCGRLTESSRFIKKKCYDFGDLLGGHSCTVA